MGKEFRIDRFLPLLIHALHIRVFHISDNLQTSGLKMLKIPCHLQCRSVDVGLGNLDPLHIHLRREVF